MHSDSARPEFSSGGPSAVGCAPEGARDFVRFLYNHNPFYVISAALVLYGLRLSFLSGDAFQTRAMIVGLMSFTLLLACTAWLIIRLGSVWNDARTILLIIVLLFVAISVSCDLSLAGFAARSVRDFQSGFENFLGSYLFALIVSEGLLLTLAIRLRFWYRLSYHLFLGLFFLYPLAVLPLMVQSWNTFLPWGLFGFSIATALALLALLPAVRRGAPYIEGHGTLWKWPFFPWSLFVILAVAAGLRHYYLCLSFHTVPGMVSLFRPYFLVPPLLAVNLLMLEAALVSGRRWTKTAALVMPLLLLALAAWQPATTFWQRQFLRDFSTLMGGHPVFITLLVCIGLYALATARRLPGAVDFLTLAIAALAVIQPLPRLADLLNPEPLAVAVAGLVQLVPALAHRSSRRLLVAACLMLAAMTIENSQTWLIEEQGIVPWHLLLSVVLVLGTLPNDPFAKRLQNVGAVMLVVPVAAWAAKLPELSAAVGRLPWALSLVFAYPLLMGLLAGAYGRFAGNKFHLTVAAINVAVWCLMAGERVYGVGRQTLAGLDYLLLGAASFIVAALISLLKTGLPQRWWSRHKA